jgi:hypothetical protein
VDAPSTLHTVNVAIIRSYCWGRIVPSSGGARGRASSASDECPRWAGRDHRDLGCLGSVSKDLHDHEDEPEAAGHRRRGQALSPASAAAPQPDQRHHGQQPDPDPDRPPHRPLRVEKPHCPEAENQQRCGGTLENPELVAEPSRDRDPPRCPRGTSLCLQGRGSGKAPGRVGPARLSAPRRVVAGPTSRRMSPWS